MAHDIQVRNTDGNLVAVDTGEHADQLEQVVIKGATLTLTYVHPGKGDSPDTETVVTLGPREWSRVIETT